MKTKMIFNQLLIYVSAIIFLMCGPLIVAAGADSNWPKDIGIASKPVGTGSYAVALSISKMIPKYVKGLKAHVAPFGTESGYIKSMVSGDVQMSITTSPFTYFAPRGLDIYAGATPIPLMILASGEPYYWPLMVRPGSGIEKASDIKGKRGMIDYAGSLTGRLGYQSKLEAYGLTVNDIILQTYGTVSEIAIALKEGRTDFGMCPVGLGTAFVQELAFGGKVILVGDTDEAMKIIYEKYPYFPPGVIPAKTFKGQDQPLKCSSLITHLGIDKRMPDDLVYAITAALFDNYKEWVSRDIFHI